MRVSVNVDGLNFYNQKMKKRPSLKWLNLYLLAQNLLGDHHQLTVHYFTSNLFEEAGQRQQLYFKALQTVPAIKTHKGRMVPDKKFRPPVSPLNTRPADFSWQSPVASAVCEPRKVKVKIRTEKQTDVHLGVRLISEAYENRFDKAYLLSNDTDFRPALLQLVRLHKDICLITPLKNGEISKWLGSVLGQTPLTMTDAHLAEAQFPDEIRNRHGALVVARPAAWRQLSLLS